MRVKKNSYLVAGCLGLMGLLFVDVASAPLGASLVSWGSVAADL